jgi:hypothetical protein
VQYQAQTLSKRRHRGRDDIKHPDGGDRYRGTGPRRAVAAKLLSCALDDAGIFALAMDP